MRIKTMAFMGFMLGLVVTAPSVYAHATYNVGGFGDVDVSANPSNSTLTPPGAGEAKIYTGATTGGGLTGSLYKSGATNGNEVWVNESPATEWIGGGPNHAGSSAGSVLPSAAYIGMHSLTQNRLIETGVYGSSSAICAANGDCAAINTNGNSLLQQVYTQNHNSAFYSGGPSNTNLLPTNFSLAVAGNSWNNGVYNTGMDVLNPHVSGYQFGFPNDSTAHPSLEQNLLDQAAPGTQVFLNVDVFDDKSDGLGDQQMGVALYGGWDDGNGLADLTYISSALAPVGSDGHAKLTYELQQLGQAGHYFGEYTVLVGDNSSIGGQYMARFTITTVPVPGAVWLFGSALAGLLGYGRSGRIKALRG